MDPVGSFHSMYVLPGLPESLCRLILAPHMGLMVGDVTNFCCSCAVEETLTGGLLLPKLLIAICWAICTSTVLLAADSSVDYEY